MLRNRVTVLLTSVAFVLSACGGGGGGNTVAPTPTPQPTPTPTPTPSALAYPVLAQESLTSADVTRVVSQAVGEAQARGLPSTIVVVDRVGNVLAAYQMTGANTLLSVPAPPGGGRAFDLQDKRFPGAAVAGAIAKAVTAAYLSSSGNAFTPRTASDIVQEFFPKSPQTVGLESGPLFGVQFSQLPCSDLNRRFGSDAMLGPKRSPLGLSGDPGAVPLYKNGVVVGGVGIMGDGVYSVDDNAADVDVDNEEYIALAASQGFAAAPLITADKISIDGTTLGFIDAVASGLRGNGAAPALAGAGSFIAVRGYYDGSGALAGAAYGNPQSGYRQVTSAERTAGTAIDNPDAYILTNADGSNRYPIRGGTEPTSEVAQPLTAAEVRAIAEEAFKVLSRARGAIRQPLNSQMQATISVIDSRGQILAIQRSPDAPIFGTDVSLQKARTAAFFSSARAAAQLQGVATSPAAVDTLLGYSNSADISAFVQKFRDFLSNPTALTGQTAFAERPIGLLSRPYFPDGQARTSSGAVNTLNGPLSRPIASFSPFSTGLQSALVLTNIALHVLFVLGQSATDTPARCTFLPDIVAGQNPLQNGIQIFPGGEPIYRGNTLVGAVGLSGDGIDQDDVVSFLGIFNGGARAGTVGHAAPAMRISAVNIPQNSGGFLPYVQCPFAPFLDTSEQNVCQGK